MARTLFFCMVFRKFSEITKNKPSFSQYIFFTIMNISFFSLPFDLFSIIAKEVNQIRNNVVCVVARHRKMLDNISDCTKILLLQFTD